MCNTCKESITVSLTSDEKIRILRAPRVDRLVWQRKYGQPLLTYSSLVKELPIRVLVPLAPLVIFILGLISILLKLVKQAYQDGEPTASPLSEGAWTWGISSPFPPPHSRQQSHHAPPL